MQKAVMDYEYFDHQVSRIKVQPTLNEDTYEIIAAKNPLVQALVDKFELDVS